MRKCSDALAHYLLWGAGRMLATISRFRCLARAANRAHALCVHHLCLPEAMALR